MSRPTDIDRFASQSPHRCAFSPAIAVQLVSGLFVPYSGMPSAVGERSIVIGPPAGEGGAM